MKRIYKKLLCVLIVLAFIAGAFVLYVEDYYRATTEAVTVMTQNSSIKKEKLSDDTIVYMPENTECGFIFYPGGKVEYTAYLPLMEACASYGVACFILEMPFNLAVLDSSAAKGIQEKYPEIDNWYIGGHSLGGSMAATYISACEERFSGLVLLGAYSTSDISQSSIKVLSIYGSEDGVMNREKYEECKINLPDDFTEVVIDGGCHAYFGMYGEQEGDGVPAISNKVQIEKTADIIAGFVK